MDAIAVRDLCKKFKVYYDKGYTLKERVLFQARNHYEDRWVLKGISFDVARGEAVGFIGENGSGKSTLLKLLSKILYPDKGSVQVNGRVSSLIELGAGFHPDMSGRENIYLNAAIFGLKRNEINERLKQIIAFSELEKYIDNPIRTYSSGMYMRLAFAVAINVNADVLLIDEILAVGDVNFQKKCFDKLKEIKAKGTTIAIVSHSLGQIEEICDRSMWIENGRLRMTGVPSVVHSQYLQFMQQKQSPDLELIAEQKRMEAQMKGRLDTRDLAVDIKPLDLKPIDYSTQDFKLKVTNKTKQILSPEAEFPICFTYHVYDSRGKMIIEEGMRSPLFKKLSPGESAEGIIHLDLSPLSSTGTNEYILHITLVQESQFWFDRYDSSSVLAIPFTVMHHLRLDTNDLLVKIERTDDVAINRDTRQLKLQLTNKTHQTLATAAPYPVFLTYRVIDQYGDEIVEQRTYVPLSGVLAPNEKMSLNLKTDLSKLQYAGRYILLVTLVQEQQFWFDTYNPSSALVIPFELTGRLETKDLDVVIERTDNIPITQDTHAIQLQVLNKTRQKLATVPPYPVHLSYHILSDDGRELIYDGLRTPISTPLMPDETQEIALNIDLSSLKLNNNYLLQVSLVQESQFWFEAYNKNVLLTVPFKL